MTPKPPLTGPDTRRPRLSGLRGWPAGWIQAATAATVFLALLWLRTRGVTQSFWLYGDQIRDWQLALGAWRDLPLAGPPSSIGGTGWGPAFYWVLWLVRHTVGPWTDNLPHAGGIGIALMQSLADAVLLLAIWRRMASPVLALAVVLIVGTNPFDLAISATIWNPPVAVAFVKLTIALVLWNPGAPSLWRAAGAAATAWAAVQCHSTAVFLAVPVILAFPVREWAARRWRRAMAMTAVTAGVVGLLQVPLVLSHARQPATRTSSPLVMNSVAHALAHPSAIHLGRAFQSVAGAFRQILSVPLDPLWLGVILVLCAVIAAVRLRGDLALVSVTVVPLTLLVLGFVTWDRPFETHWCLSLAPCLVLTIGVAVTSAPWRRTAQAGAIVLAVAALLAVPSRVREASTLFRMPEYGPLVEGSRTIVQRTRVIRAVQTSLALPPSLPADYLYRLLGGHVAPDAPFIATIVDGGHVRFTQAQDR